MFVGHAAFEIDLGANLQNIIKQS